MGISINGYNPLQAAITPRVGRNDAGQQLVEQGEDTVTISHAAQAAYRGDATPSEDGRRGLRLRIDNDPDFAAGMARSAAYGTDLLAVEPSSLRPGQTPRFYDGTPTSNRAYRDQYQQLIGKVREQRIAYYEQERANGTPPRELFEKIEAFNRALPEPYQLAVGYQR